MNSKITYAALMTILMICQATVLRGQTEAATTVPSSAYYPYELAGTSTGKPMRFAVKVNLIYGAVALAPNLGFEIGLAPRSTFDLSGGINAWNLDGSGTDNRKLAHWIARGEYRYWFCERFSGHFLGFHAFYSKYNISGHEMPLLFGKGSENYRYDGYVVGGGISYGYNLMLSRKWNIEFTVGAGYGYMRYDRYDCEHCGTVAAANQRRNYFGPTSAGITLVYLIK